MTVTTAGEAKKDFMKYKIDEQFRPLDLLVHKPLNRGKLAASNIFLKNFFTLTKRKGGIVYRRYRLKSFDGKHFDTHTFVPRERADGVTPCLIYFHGGAFNFPFTD